MFSFFKINDPYRLIAIFVIAFAIKIPFLINSNAFFDMHHWLIIGEAMKSGSMYDQIFDTLSPLAASTYWILVSLFGKSTLTLQILGTLVLILQAIIFNNLTIQNKVYEQNTYLPAFVYIIISSTHFGLSVLSPAQLGMTFILLAFSKLLAHVEFRAKRDEHIMDIGLLLGIAVLFYIPYIVFLPIVLFILILFTNTLHRRYIILLVSILTPFGIAFTYYWLVNGETGYFMTNLVIPSLTTDFLFLTEIGAKITLFLPVIIFIVLGYISMPKQRRLNNYQNRLANLFFITGLLTLLMFVFKETKTYTAIIILVPIASYFASHLFFLLKRPLTDFLVSIVFVVFVLGLCYDSEFDFVGVVPKIQETTHVESDLQALVEGKKIMVLGDKPQIYEYGSLATPFYNWPLSTTVITNLEYYDNLVFVKESIIKHQPEIILDYEHTWRKIMDHIPELKKDYKQIKPFVWQRTK